jgi:predicted permease
MNDLRLAIRALRRSPVVSAVAVLSLALGLGANTAVFSVVNGLLLRPLPVEEPERLVTVSSDFAVRHGFKAGLGMNHAMWRRMEERADLFDGGFAWAPAVFDLSQGGEMQPVNGLVTSGGFFTTLGVRALIGRTFTAQDDAPGGGPDGPVAVISYGLWQRRFGGAAGVLGTPLHIDGVPCTIVGVTQPSFFGVEVGQPFDIVVPLAADPLIRGVARSLHSPNALLLTVMLRLKPGQSLDEATATLRTRQPQILEAGAFPRGETPTFLREAFTLVPAATGTSDRSRLRRQYQRPLLTILAVVALVLLIACANVANLLLARATARRHELSVRLALGASRWRLARQLLLESVVLAGAGTVAGVLVAGWAAPALVAGLSTADVQISLNLPLDWRVMGFAAVACLVTTAFFGTSPAFRATRVAPIDALKDHTRGGSGGRRTTVSSGFVVAQIALSLVLLVVAGLLVRTFERLAKVPLGFDADRVLVINVDTARAHVDAKTRDAYFDRLVSAVAAVPGVAHAAGSRTTPLSASSKSPLNAEPGRVIQHVVTPGWFAVYGMALRSGRDFTPADSVGAPRVAVVNEAYARRFLQEKSVLGAPLDSGPCGEREGRCTVVGVVGDAVFGSVRGAKQAAVYVPMGQSAASGPPGRTSVSISVRAASGSPSRLNASVAEALASVSRNLAFSFRPLAADVDAAVAQERVVALLSGFFGVLALLLAGLGLYGVTAYTVTRQRAEIGIRLALGASPGAVRRLVIRRVALLVASGLVVGSAVSLWASRFVAALLYGLEPGDPFTFAAACLTLAAVGAFAGWLPAYRASLIDPAAVLRNP